MSLSSVGFQRVVTTVEHEARGTHLLVTLRGCDPALLNDTQALSDLVQRAATATGATVLQTGAQRFEPQGVTAFVVLAESHASLHTYPESKTVFWDCFTCGDTCVPERSINVLVDALRPSAMSMREILRD